MNPANSASMSSKMPTPLVMGENFSLNSTPHKAPGPSSPRVLVIGGGVTGIITAWVLLDRGYRVTILSKEWATYTNEKRLVSQIAGALWEFPPAVCGQHTNAISLRKSKRWSMVAYKIWDAIAADPTLAVKAGVRMKVSAFCFLTPVEDDPKQLSKMLEIQKSAVRGFCHNKCLIQAEDIDPAFGVVDAYEHLAPIIDTDHSMKWLLGLVKSKGAKIVTETLHGDLLDHEDELLSRFKAHAIVNATGLAGAELAGDSSCYPIRGGLLRVINDGTDFPKINTALAISADAIKPGSQEFIFVLPRNDNILLLGGLAQPHETELDLTLDSPDIKRMRARCEAFLPKLKNARLDPEYPLAQGLRPFRERNVRVERESRPKRVKRYNNRTVRENSRIIHSYGQGGSGWCLSFGCAEETASLVDDVLRNVQVRLSRVNV